MQLTLESRADQCGARFAQLLGHLTKSKSLELPICNQTQKQRQV